MQQVSVREGRPGQWMGVFGDALTLLVPGTERDRALRWWGLVDDGAGMEVLLDALLAEGLSALDDFVLVHVGDEGRVRVVVRGSATLRAWTAEGQVQVQASGRLWAEDDFRGIVALRVELPGHDWLAATPSFVVQPGLCRVGEVVWGSVPAPPSATDEPAGLSAVPAFADVAPEDAEPEDAEFKDAGPDEATPEPETPVAQRPTVLGKHLGTDESQPVLKDEAVRVNVVSSGTPPVPVPTSIPTPVPAPTPTPSEEPEPPASAPVGKRAATETEAETAPLSAVPLVAPESPSAAPEQEDVQADAGRGDGQLDPHPVDPGPQTPVSTPIPQWQEEVTTHLPPVELSGLTLLGLATEPDDATQSRSERPTTPSTSAGTVRLRFSHGPSALVDRPLVIGRAPAPRSASAGASLVTVPSPQQEISSNHVEIRPGQGIDTGTALVTDLGSTNGTVVTQPGLGPEELRPGAPMVLLPGAVIDLGDGLRIHVDQG